MMSRFWILVIIALVITGCAISPDQATIQTGLEDSQMNAADKNPETEAVPAEGDLTVQERLPGVLLFDFADSSENWNSVDDDVMGGVSSSAGQILDTGALLFSGTMSLDNNGGFSSIRSPWNPIDLSGKDGLLIRVLGDGKIYRLRIRTTETGSQVAYNSFFETSQGEWSTVYIPFNTMVPSRFGFRVQTGELNPGAISSFGFMLSDKQEGEFSLQVDWLRAVTEEEVFPDGLPSAEG
jgi:monofunctional biosynthetic peptidoglycan transglycosylase